MWTIGIVPTTGSTTVGTTIASIYLHHRDLLPMRRNALAHVVPPASLLGMRTAQDRAGRASR
jgi:hypothetical protein